MRALIAMSGGVDSSVAAYLMMRKGYEAAGCTMKLLDAPPEDEAGMRSCCGLEEVEDARAVARRLGIPFYVFNYKDAFAEQVIGRFIASYRSGVTPNPCIDCNRYLKFGKLLQRSRELGCDCLVTGHYARVEEENGRFLLKKALDTSKDQSYVLYNLTQEQLRHIYFPLGDLHKTKVREIAEEQGFGNAGKPDSQDICFVPDGDYAKFIEKSTGIADIPGDFIGKDGEILGQHKGITHYTVGQRRGLGVSAGERLYVKGIFPKENKVLLVRREELQITEGAVKDCNWISGNTPTAAFPCTVRTRYHQKEQQALVFPQADGTARIVFEQPQKAVTPGQAAVFYDGDIVLGGGTITN